MFNKKVIVALIFLLFLTCSTSSAFLFFGDGLEYDNIFVDEFDTEITNYSFVKSDGDIYFSYQYSVSFGLDNVLNH